MSTSDETKRTHSARSKSASRKRVAKKRAISKRRVKKSAQAHGTARPKKDEVTPDTPVPATASLLALSPYRFPVDIERLIISTVRVSGFALVVFGLFATYHYIESSATELAIRASQTASISSAMACDASCMRDRVTPPVSFAYEQIQPYTYRITISVAEAERVTVYAFDPSSEQYVRLGAARHHSDDTWHYEWRTDNMRPGEYWIKAVIANRHGVYDRSDSTYLTID